MDRADVLLSIGIFIGGLVVAGLMEWWRAWWTWKMERSSRRAEFQREVLLELQDAIEVWINALGPVLMARGDKRQDEVCTPLLSRLQEADARMLKLWARVDDELVRKVVGAMLDAGTAASDSPDPQGSALTSIFGQYMTSMGLVGKALRDLSA